MSDEEIDLSSRIADVAVRVKKPTQANLIFKKFVNFHNHIYGSSDYLQKVEFQEMSMILINMI